MIEEQFYVNSLPGWFQEFQIKWQTPEKIFVIVLILNKINYAEDTIPLHRQ